MQLLQASSEALIKPLSTVIGIVEKRSTMPILMNILINKVGSRVEFLATDLDVEITTFVDLGSPDSNASFTVQAKRMFDVLKSLPSAAETELLLEPQKHSSDAERLIVKSTGSRFSLLTIDAEQFPRMDKPKEWITEFTLPQKELLRLFSMVSFAMAKQDIRYYLNGILVVMEPGNTVRTVATDGHRLAHMALSLDQDLQLTEEKQIILPSKTVVEMQRLLDDSDEPVKISVGERNVRFEFGNIEFFSKLIEGRFPDFRRVIPQDYQTQIHIKREQLQRCLQRASILVADDRMHGIKLKFEDNLLRIFAQNQEQEEAKIEMEVNNPDAQELEVGFNANYLLDVVASARSEEIVFSVKPNSSSSSVLVTIPDAENFKYVVMPLRI
ncbi:DNA polymerase III subunit beta [Brackiella oedipodis]|uniref:DNA polymerase III subunit beta n=1 Tax=Brackiella oedipodis TaxID=124225 RepID=UPI00048B1E15|nr:DNA polymerase III subunit beta [Brackiella oedipodis]